MPARALEVDESDELMGFHRDLIAAMGKALVARVSLLGWCHVE